MSSVPKRTQCQAFQNTVQCLVFQTEHSVKCFRTLFNVWYSKENTALSVSEHCSMSSIPKRTQRKVFQNTVQCLVFQREHSVKYFRTLFNV